MGYTYTFHDLKGHAVEVEEDEIDDALEEARDMAKWRSDPPNPVFDSRRSAYWADIARSLEAIKNRHLSTQ